MKKRLKIMLLGSLPKGDEARSDFFDWKTEYVKKIQDAIPEALFLHGDLISDKEGIEAVVGHDLWLVKGADIVLVNAPSKIGAGTAQEMVLAKKFKKPVISLIPKDTHHRRSNIVFHGAKMKEWIHPFIAISSDVVVENIEEAIRWIKSFRSRSKKIKDISVFDKAIAKFEKRFVRNVREYKSQGW